MRFLDAILSPFRWLGARFSSPATKVASSAMVLAGSQALTGAGAAASSSKEYLEPQYRVVIDWTPALLKIALRSADGGNLRTAADLCDAILGDDRAPAVLGTRCAALLGCEVTFELGVGRRKRRTLKSLEAEEDFWTAFPEDELSQLITWGILLGVGLGELVWFDDPETGRTIPRLKVWHPRHLRWDWPTRRWMLKVDGETEIAISPGDGKWILYTPYGSSRPWAHGLWRGMAPLWLLKEYAKKDFGLVQELHGEGIMVGTAPTPARRNELAQILRDLGRSAVLALPAETDIKIVESTARNWEMYTAQIELSNTGFSVQVIGTNLPTEVTSGVGTGATAQNLVRLDYKRRDGETLATTLRSQALVWWAEFNFGSAALAPWPAWQVEPPLDRQAASQRWLTTAQALRVLDPTGVWEVDLKDVEEELGLKLTKREAQPIAATPPQGNQNPDETKPN